MEKYRRVGRIEAIIERIDQRGCELMARAVATGGGPGYMDCVHGLMVLTNRCMKLSAWINDPSWAPRRRTA